MRSPSTAIFQNQQYFTVTMSSKIKIFLFLFVGFCSCLQFFDRTRYNSPQELYNIIYRKTLAKAPSDGQSLSQYVVGYTSPLYSGKSWLRKRGTLSRALPEQDQKALKAAKMFLSNDHVSLEQAMKKYNVPAKTSSSSHGSTGLL